MFPTFSTLRTRSAVLALVTLGACADSPTTPGALQPTAPPAAAMIAWTSTVERLASPPASVRLDVLQAKDRAFHFMESAQVTLASPLSVDFADTAWVSRPTLLPSLVRTIPAGTVVDAHLVHFDVDTAANMEVTGRVTFETDVLGVIVTDAGLNGTDAALGAPGTSYPTTNRRSISNENGDRIKISGDRRTIDFVLRVTGDYMDQFRVITVADMRDRTPPTITFTGNAGTYTVDQMVQITCTVTDAGGVDASQTSCPSVSAPAYSFAGTTTLTATAKDNAGNTSSAQASFTVVVDAGSLCTLTRRWANQVGIRRAMCVKLEHGSYAAYIHQARAQSGKAITAENAAILIRLAQVLLAGG